MPVVYYDEVYALMPFFSSGIGDLELIRGGRRSFRDELLTGGNLLSVRLMLHVYIPSSAGVGGAFDRILFGPEGLRISGRR